MRLAGLSLGLTILAGCATSSVTKIGHEQFVSGENGDLRVFVDRTCSKATWLDEQWRTHVRGDTKAPGTLGDRSPGGAGGLGGFAVDALSYIGSLAFQSFGTFLQKAGEAGVTQSYAETGGYFYTERAPAGLVPGTSFRTDIAPEMRCIYLVRNGFSLKPSQFDPSAPEDLRRKWAELGLNKTPDFFSILHLETTADAELVSRLPRWLDDIKSHPAPLSEGAASKLTLSPPAPYFRIALDRLYVREFQNPQAASSYRDLAIVLNYDLAGSSQRRPSELSDAARARNDRPGFRVPCQGILQPRVLLIGEVVRDESAEELCLDE